MSQTQKNFSQASQSYESVSYVQKDMAQQLYDLISQDLQPGRFMEYGVGTGHLSHLLAQDERAKELEFVDFSLPMLFQAQMKVMSSGTQARTNFIEADIESHNLPTCASAYISNATIQWLKDFDAFVQKCSIRLESGAMMAFSAFGENHFHEFYESARNVFGKSSEVQVKLYTQEALQSIALKHGFTVQRAQSQQISETFDSLKSILQYISQMGAQDDPKAYPLTPSRWRQWQDIYPTNSTGTYPLTWHYHLECWIKK